MHTKTLAELSQALRDKTISSVELTQHYLDRIKKYDSTLNSFVTVTDELALTQAKRADEQLAAGNASALTGIPFAHKDIFCTKGVKTTSGSKMLDNFIAPYDATVTEKLNQAGMVMLGKTNMDEFAMGSSNETSFYGPVKNPWNTYTVPGGSSGGSASAVAARIAPIATGTDTGGSIRQPAALCGLTGLKPTYGRVSRFGMIAFASSLDQAGPMGQTAEDVAMMLNAMAGHDPKDSTSVQKDVPDYTSDLNNDLTGLRIGIPKEFFNDQLDPNIAKQTLLAIQEYEKLGATFVDIELPSTDLSVGAYYIIAPAECSTNLSRYDGVRFGYRCDNPKDLTDLYSRSRSEAFGNEVKRRIMLGTHALSAGYYDAYYLKAQKIRRVIKEGFDNAFEVCDVIMGPTSPSTAFAIGDRCNDPISMYLCDMYTIAVNLAGLPGMSIPAGLVHDMPVGLQIIGKHFDEAKLLNVAHKFQQATDYHQQHPSEF
jgi:aspartyl-tRNA(Asn)/glutamyl-tRNA(Gln) amidotransferase subunit A